MSIAEDFEVRLAVDTYLVVGIDGHQRHLAQHSQHVVGLAVVILGHVIADAVHLLLDELALGGYRHIFQLDVVKHLQQGVIDPVIIATGWSRLRRHRGSVTLLRR